MLLFYQIFNFSINRHYAGSILEFIAEHEKIDEFKIYHSMEGIDFLVYVKNLDEVLNFSDNSLYECFTKNGFSKNEADYFSVCYENGSIKQLSLSENVLAIIKDYEKNLLQA